MKRMSMIGAVALGVTLVWACSSAVEDVIFTPDASAEDRTSESKSGSRLEVRPIVYEGDDGSVIRMGEEIFDTELGVVCAPQRGEDGERRCLPQKYVSAPFFGDPSCTQPVARAGTLCAGDIALEVVEAQSCTRKEATFRAWEVEAIYNGPDYEWRSGECVPTIVSDSNPELARLRPVPPSEFVILQK